MFTIDIGADHPEFDAQVPAESAACVEARLKVISQRRRTTSQDVRLPRDSVHCCDCLSESAGMHCHIYAMYVHIRTHIKLYTRIDRRECDPEI